MKSYKNLFPSLCSYQNLYLAFQKARKGKSKKPYVIEFEKHLQNNLFKLQWELLTKTYNPKPIKFFTVRDPKTRRIGASKFRDRVVHHALINLIQPIFECRFIQDSYANRKHKGTKAALQRFDCFLRRVANNGKLAIRERERGSSNNNCIIGYALKADISKYFETIDHEILLSIIQKRIKDKEIIWLIKSILANHKSKIHKKGMPLGNLTSQFFANLYLNELDYFVKHKLKAKYYLRYVDDFAILSKSKNELIYYRNSINSFLTSKLSLTLHPQKSKIIPLHKGITLLGFRIFYLFKLLKKSNQSRIKKRIEKFKKKLSQGKITKEHILLSFAGWEGYAKMANSYILRAKLKKELPE